MQEPGHHHTMSRYTHSSGTYVGIQHIGTIRSSMLPLQQLVKATHFKHQSIRITLDTCHRRIGWKLVVEKHTPVITVRHSQFTVSQGQLGKNLVPHFLPMPRQRLMKFRRSVFLKIIGSQNCFGLFLHHHILIGSMEIVMVLKCIVWIKIGTNIPFPRLLSINHRCIVSIGIYGIAVKAIANHRFLPLRRMRMRYEVCPGYCQNVGFPPVFFGFRITLETERNGT